MIILHMNMLFAMETKRDEDDIWDRDLQVNFSTGSEYGTYLEFYFFFQIIQEGDKTKIIFKNLPKYAQNITKDSKAYLFLKNYFTEQIKNLFKSNGTELFKDSISDTLKNTVVKTLLSTLENREQILKKVAKNAKEQDHTNDILNNQKLLNDKGRFLKFLPENEISPEASDQRIIARTYEINGKEIRIIMIRNQKRNDGNLQFRINFTEDTNSQTKSDSHSFLRYPSEKEYEEYLIKQAEEKVNKGENYKTY